MANKIIKFGKWDKKSIEWEVLTENKHEMLVISRYSIASGTFDRRSSVTSWEKSGLRSFLEKEFYDKAFSDEEKKKIINTKLKDSDNSKDNVFILSEQEVGELLAEGDEYQNNRSCSRCAWTRTKSGSYVRVGYVQCQCSKSPTSLYCVRPAMYLKNDEKGFVKNAQKN